MTALILHGHTTKMAIKPETRRSLTVGFVQWLAAGLAALSAYMLTLDTFAEWDWFTVVKGTLAQVSAGLVALGRFLGLPDPKPEPTPERPNYDEFTIDDELADTLSVPSTLASTAVMRTKHFSQAELECKGQTCDCEFPGMSPTSMEIVEDLRAVFGPLTVNSAYRCRIHNENVGGEDDSFHKEEPGRALDVRSDTYPAREMYEYLDAKYPRQFGFGLYKKFVHLDDRNLTWARKASPDAVWKEFKHKNADIELA